MLPLVLPLILPLLFADAPAAGAAAGPVTLKKLAVTRYAHSQAADQYKSPGEHALTNAFDGNPNTTWYVPRFALGDPGYTVEAAFSGPVQVDHVRLVVDPMTTTAPAPTKGKAAPPPGKPARLARVELNFWDRSLSTRFPIYKRALSIPADRPTADLGLTPPLKWNPQLINDDDFGDRRRAKGYGEAVPFPVTIDALSITIVETTPGDLPATLTDVQLLVDRAAVPIGGVAELKAKHAAFIENGLKHIIEGRYFVGPTRTLQFSLSGSLYEIPAADWQAGRTDDKARKKLGAWRIEASRLEVAAGGGKKFEPVDYALDESPTRVEFRTAPVAGEYAVAVSPPAAAAAPASAAPASAAAPDAPAPAMGNAPGYEPPPLLE